MKLLFKNEFAWDGLYWIVDEANVEKYYIDARLSENSRNIYVFDPEHKEVGAIRQKTFAEEAAEAEAEAVWINER